MNSVPVAPLPTFTARSQIRGSSLLVVGTVLSMGINFATQVLLVRYLSTRSYGIWTYALSIVALWKTFAPLGVDEAISRFVPLYHERGERARLVGAILLAMAIVIVTSGVVIIAYYAAPDRVARLMTHGNDPMAILLIMIFLVPLETLDIVIMNLFACFSRPKAIFFRRHVLGPGLRFVVVLALVALHSNLKFLAYGYLAASVLGIILYAGVLVTYLKRLGLFDSLRLRDVQVPIRELLAFSIPLMTTDLMTVVNGSVIVVILGYFHGFSEVAMYRVVLPAAALNKVVMTGFAFLYTPYASRLFARGDGAALDQLYWRTALWLGLASFPIFAITFCFARPLTVLMFGQRYAESGILLALMSLGYYFNVVTGFNGLTLKVYGKVRYVASVNILAALGSIVLSAMLIPHFGALGAAISSASAMILHNILKQAGLRMASGISIFHRECVPFYALIATSAGGLLLLQLFAVANVFAAAALVLLVSCLILFVANQSLCIGQVFPEARRLPLLGRFLA